jgi:uncharacterized membrane-anchored protein
MKRTTRTALVSISSMYVTSQHVFGSAAASQRGPASYIALVLLLLLLLVLLILIVLVVLVVLVLVLK